MARERLTAGRVREHAATPGQAQAFLWDTEAPGLALRTTAAAKKSFIFQAKLPDRQAVRVTIGPVDAWTLSAARDEARRLRMLTDQGIDPREVERQQNEERQAKAAAQAAQTVTVATAWDVYLAERRPHWSDRHYRDQIWMASAGGRVSARGTRGRGVTIGGPLHEFMGTALRDITAEMIESWAKREGARRPTRARLALRCFRAFLGWCAEHPDYRAVVPAVPAKTTRTREALGKAQAKSGALLSEQLPAWFAAVRGIDNPVMSAYLQALLLMGCRPSELRGIRWDDIDTQWRSVTIRDKVEGQRTIPMPPYVERLLMALPRRGQYVFNSTRHDAPITSPNHIHDRACDVAGINRLTLHDLRRSFGSLAEWLEMPAGVVAQIQGHKPSATAERHYRVRPLDLLRLHHERLEAWILEQAGIEQPEPGSGAIRRVK